MAIHLTRGIRCAVLVSIALLCAPYGAEGEDSVRDVLFDDCDTAKKIFVEQHSDEDQQLYGYLTRVLALNTQGPGVPEAFIQVTGTLKNPAEIALPGAKGNELGPGRLWQTVDAKRELAAKRCALDIFAMAGSRAAPALGRLAIVYGQQNLSDEIGVEIEEVTADIAEQAHLKGYTPSAEELNTAIEQLTSPHPLVAINIVEEYREAALPQLLNALKTAEKVRVEQYTAALQLIDPDGTVLFEKLLDVAPNLAPDEVATLLNVVPLPAPLQLKRFVDRIAALAASDQAELAKLFGRVLGKVCVELDTLQIPTELEERLGKTPSITSDETVSPEQLRCLVSRVPSIAKRVPYMIFPTELSELPPVFELITVALPNLGDEERNYTFTQLKQVALSPDPAAAALALRLLWHFPGKRSEILGIVSQLTKSGSGPVRPPLGTALLETLSHLAPIKDPTPFTPFVLAQIGTGASAELIRGLLPKDKKLDVVLYDLLDKGRPEVRSGVISILGTEQYATKRILKRFSELYADPALRGAIQQAFVTIGSHAAPTVRALMPKATGSDRVNLLAVLQGYGLATKQETVEIAGSLSSLSCEQVSDRASLVVAILSQSELSQEQATRKLAARVAECLPAAAAAPLWISEIPKVALASQQTVATLASATGSPLPAGYHALLEATMSGHPSLADDGSLLATFLASGPKDVKLSVLAYLARGSQDKASFSPPVLRSLRELVAAKDTDINVQAEALTLLAKSGAPDYDWKDFADRMIAEAGNGGDISVWRPVLKALPAEIVLGEVEPALDATAPKSIRGATVVGAALGSSALPIVSRLWSLRRDHAPSIRYAALLALLEINPLTPDLHQHLKGLLVTRYFEDALRRPIKWNESVAALELKKEKLGLLRTVRYSTLMKGQ